jgi:hypothetical protein
MSRLSTGSAIALTLMALAAIVTHRSAFSALVPEMRSGGDLVVESALDAGPGTLRDAIMAADRLSTRAHIVISVPRIVVESALPALVNPHGVDIEVRAGAGVIDAGREAKGTVLQINSQGSIVRGLQIINAHDIGMLVNAPGVRIEATTVSASKTALYVAAAAAGCVVSNSTFEGNETGVIADAAIHDLSILSSIFRRNTRAGFWLVGAEGSGADPDGHERARIVEAVFEKNVTGMVLANSPTLIQKARFIANSDTGLLVLGGAARVEDSEFSDAVGTALSINSASRVVIARSKFVNNAANAIMARNSDISIENDTLVHNGFGLVLVQSQEHAVVVRDNSISRTKADAITVIGGSPLLQRNQITDNFGAGIRVLDLASAQGSRKALPRLDANVVKGNGIDVPPPAIYKVVDAR